MEIKSGESLYLKTRTSVLDRLINVLLAVIFVLSVFLLLFNMRYTGVYVVNSSMLPTIVGAPSKEEPGGDYVYMDTFAKPDYGDIVIISPEKKDDHSIIKRAFAFGGDRIYIEQGVVYVKYAGSDEFKAIENEPYVSEENHRIMENYANSVDENGEKGLLINDGEIFVLGDNRDVSADSRLHGPFRLDDVRGVVPGWALNIKSFTTKLNLIFAF